MHKKDIKKLNQILTGNAVKLDKNTFEHLKNICLYMENIIAEIPVSVYWMDKDCVYIGCSNSMARLLKLKSRRDIIGKTYADLYDEKSAKHYKKADRYVMETGVSLNLEEPLYSSDGTKKIYLSNKVPLRDSNGDIIGMLGVSVDITERKKMEKDLRIAKEKAEAAIVAKIKAEEEEKKIMAENVTNKAHLEGQAQFTKIANQVAHDIRSPLASLLMILQSCSEIPEKKRIDLREASTRIGDIANNLLNQYKIKDSVASGNIEISEPVLLSATLLQLVTEKKFQYQGRTIKFNYNFSQEGHFVFINVELSAFERMVSNLVNNAVDAFGSNEGEVTLRLDANNELVSVIVQDNGKGMPAPLVEKIMRNIEVSEGKSGGHGIGLTQVREMLARNHGAMFIHSTEGEGTQIICTFPRIQAPIWCAEEIQLSEQDIIIILDDDKSIHGAWDSRFEIILKQAPQMRIYHFEVGKEALNFINKLSDTDKKRVFLLTDFELLKQDLNGLDVVQKANIQRSILVTSHYSNSSLHDKAIKLMTKILPKQFASEIPIRITTAISCFNKSTQQENQKLRLVHAIVVDDDADYIKNLVEYVFDEEEVLDCFQDPDSLNAKLANYPKETRIFLDNNFENSKIKGLDVAKDLHNRGYTKLCLLSGSNFIHDEMPDYLTAILKTDLDKIKAW